MKGPKAKITKKTFKSWKIPLADTYTVVVGGTGLEAVAGAGLHSRKTYALNNFNRKIKLYPLAQKI